MENGENILDAILEDDNLDDVEMIDVEEGELVEQHDSQNVSVQNGVVEADNKKPHSRNRRRRANKRNRRKGSATTGAIDIDRFVINTCRRLKEKKSYMVYTAVACLGVSALSDLINEIFIRDHFNPLPELYEPLQLFNYFEGGPAFDYEYNSLQPPGSLHLHDQAVEAIQACGGQKTADGRRFRTGGGVLWSIIKVREPNAYKEIMKKAKEFEKQFRQPSVKQPPVEKKEDSSQGEASTFASGHQGNDSDKPFPALQIQDQQHKPSCPEEKRNSVHDRLSIPVSYDDELLGLSADNDTA